MISFDFAFHDVSQYVHAGGAVLIMIRLIKIIITIKYFFLSLWVRVMVA